MDMVFLSCPTLTYKEGPQPWHCGVLHRHGMQPTEQEEWGLLEVVLSTKSYQYCYFSFCEKLLLAWACCKFIHSNIHHNCASRKEGKVMCGWGGVQRDKTSVLMFSAPKQPYKNIAGIEVPWEMHILGTGWDVAYKHHAPKVGFSMLSKWCDPASLSALHVLEEMKKKKIIKNSY